MNISSHRAGQPRPHSLYEPAAASASFEEGDAPRAIPPSDLVPPLPSRPEEMKSMSAAEASALALSVPQRLAIEHLTAGYSLIASATAAGVTRMTLYRWMNRDAHFQAAYNAWQLDALTAARTRLLAATDDAVTTIVNAVRTNPRIALSVLKSIGALDRPAPGSTDPEEVQQAMHIEREKTQAKLAEEALFASLVGLGSSSTNSRGSRKTPVAESLIAALGKDAGSEE